MNINSEFCIHCKSFIDIPLIGDYIECNNCKFRTNIRDIRINPIITVKDYSKNKKKWLEDYNNRTGTINNDNNKQFDIIEQACINNNCDSNKCYYTARQLRSADEGQTIFYQCIKCGERFTLNN